MADRQHRLDTLSMVPFGVAGVCDLRTRLTKSELSRLEPELRPNDRPGILSEPRRMSAMRIPTLELTTTIRRSALPTPTRYTAP